MAMLSAKKLIKMARKWQKFAAMQRKRISFPRNDTDADRCSTSSSSIVDKGHFVVYTADQPRFVVPLAYLENEVIRQLLSMSEEEFGLPRGGPITFPCDSAFMSYIISLITKGVTSGDLHKATAPLNSIMLLFNFFYAPRKWKPTASCLLNQGQHSFCKC